MCLGVRVWISAEKKKKKKKSLLSAFEGSDAAFDVAVSNKVASPRDSAVPLPPSRVP